MRRPQALIAATAAVAAILLACRWDARAQAPPAAGKGSLQDALLRPFDLRFAEPTPLEEAARRLGRELGANVVVDRGALSRLGLSPEEPVQLELEGVRLKTGLQLLLDQLGLTYRVEPEDNLLVLTDLEGAGRGETIGQVLAELRTIHREIHDLRDAVDILYEDLGLAPPEPAMRKPTIVEPLPQGEPGDPAPPEAPKRSRSGI